MPHMPGPAALPLALRSMSITFFFYIAVGVLGYMALGNAVPDNVLLVRTTDPHTSSRSCSQSRAATR